MSMRNAQTRQSDTTEIAAALRDFARASLVALTGSFDQAMSLLLERIVALVGAGSGALLLTDIQAAADDDTDAAQTGEGRRIRCLALRNVSETDAYLGAADADEPGDGASRWLRRSIRLDIGLAAACEVVVLLDPPAPPDVGQDAAHADELVSAVAEAAAAVIGAGLTAERARGSAAAAERQDELVRELREAENDWAQTFDAVSDPISVVASDFQVVRANAAYERMFGLESKHFGEHRCFRLGPGYDAPCVGCPLPQTIASGRPASVQQVRFPTDGHDGEYRVLQCWTYPVANAEGNVDRVVEIIKDVTEQERLRQAMSQAEALREADRLKAELLGTVSHELRSPLTSIKGYAATLLRHERRLPRDERHEFLTAITEASDRLEVIIDRLLEMSQLATGTIAIERSPIDMRRLAADAITAARQRAAQSSPGRFTFMLRTDDATSSQSGAPPLVEADPRYIREVLDNLLENAVKYSPDGGTVEVILRWFRPASSLDAAPGAAAGLADLPSAAPAQPASPLHRPGLEIIVCDTGVGIPPEHLGRIFEQFHRVDTRLTREVDGLGLGLALCQRIVELHDGRIWAESRPGEGSQFHVVLPRPIWSDDASEPSTVKG